MIDLGVNISIDQWPPTNEQYIEESHLKLVGSEVDEHWLDNLEL
jgi:hypothetical protein